MNKSDTNILATILALSEDRRIQFVERLLESLGPETDLWDEAAFAAELQRRSADIDEGKAELVTWDQLKKEPV